MTPIDAPQHAPAPGDRPGGKNGRESPAGASCTQETRILFGPENILVLEIRRAKRREWTRSWRLRNPEKHRADVAAWTAANPEKKAAANRRCSAKKTAAGAVKRAERAAVREATREARAEARRSMKRAHYAATKDDVDREARREKSKAWRLANPDRMRSLIRAWKLANPEKRRADRRLRKKRKLAALRGRLFKLQRGRCADCRRSLACAERHVDHVMPLAKKGADHRSNLQLTCAPCNLSKGARDPIEFAQSLGRLL